MYPDIQKYFMEFDPTHEKEDELFTKVGYIDIQFLAPRIKADVMMLTGLLDTSCPPITQFAMFNKITSHKESVIYPESGHNAMKDSCEKIFPFLLSL